MVRKTTVGVSMAAGLSAMAILAPSALAHNASITGNCEFAEARYSLFAEGVNTVNYKATTAEGTVLAEGTHVLEDETPGGGRLPVDDTLKIIYNPSLAGMGEQTVTVRTWWTRQDTADGHRRTISKTYEVDCGELPPSNPPPKDPPLPPVDPPVIPPIPLTPESPVATPPVDTPAKTRVNVKKLGPKKVRAGKRFTYRIVIRNSSSLRVRGLVVTDFLPRGFSVSRVPNNARLRNGRLIYRIKSIGGRGRKVIRLTGKFNSQVRGKRCNRVVVGGKTIIAGRAKACSRVIRVNRKVVPPVTG